MPRIADIPKRLEGLLYQEITVEFHYERGQTCDDGMTGADFSIHEQTTYILSGKLLAVKEEGVLFDKLKIKEIDSEKLEADFENLDWLDLNRIKLEPGIERDENKNYWILFSTNISARLKPFELPVRGEMAVYSDKVYEIRSIAMRDEKMISIDERGEVTFYSFLL